LPVLGLLWLLGAIGDRLWFALDRSIPNWDQADYLTGALNYWQALQTPQWLSGDWWTQLWQLSSKIPPLFYLSTTPFLSLFGAGADQSTLVNLLFSAILLSSVYLIGVCLLTVPAALWAVGLCLLMPGLYRVRLDFLLDFPLTAIVTLCFACLTVWREEGRRRGAGGRRQGTGGREGRGGRGQGTGGKGQGAEGLGEGEVKTHFILYPSSFILSDWLLAAAIGLTLGLSLMVKQPALLFLFVPLVWVGIETIWQRAWMRLVQLVFAVCLSMLVWVPWYRTNWLLMLSATKRATIDSAIAEQDPSLLSLDAWTYYLKALPVMISLPLLVMPLLGFLCFWRRSRVSSHCTDEADFSPKTKAYRQQVYGASREALGWLAIYCISGYLLSSLNVNKDDRYVVPYLPIVALILAYGVTLLPKRWQWVQWGAIGLAIVLMCSNLVALPLGRTPQPTAFAQHFAYTGAAYPHAQVIESVLQAAPYLRSTIGVLPSTGQINQHNINYYGNLQNFRVYGRQVGTRKSQVEQDQRSLSWFLTKTDDQGAIRQQESQTALIKAVEQGDDFTLHKSWKLPDRSTLKLFRRMIPLLEVMPVVGKAEGRRQKAEGSVHPTPHTPHPTPHTPIALDRVILPDRAPPGKPIPVTYHWSGSWEVLRSGLVVLTWRKQGKAAATERWLHDHGIGMGLLHPKNLPVGSAARFQVVERLSMLPPPAATPGIYTLEATYLDRQTGKATAIATPAVTLRLDATATTSPAPELDLPTQLRTLATALPKGGKALDPVFDQIGRINQYDPTQDYAEQVRQAMAYRLTQEPQNREFAYALALATVLKRRVGDAIVALQQVVQLDAQNPYAYGYFAFINLYDFRAGAAQVALNTALKLNPKLPEIHALSGVAALMQGNFIGAWQQFQQFERLEKQTN
jgi:4-amino-4-deoxy-L-arabinose transferase-like glycosyltransferase